MRDDHEHDLHRAHPGATDSPTTPDGWPVGHLEAATAAYETWRIEQAAIAALHALTDRELKDMGLTRGEIVHAARGLEVGGRAPSPIGRGLPRRL